MLPSSSTSDDTPQSKLTKARSLWPILHENPTLDLTLPSFLRRSRDSFQFLLRYHDLLDYYFHMPFDPKQGILHHCPKVYPDVLSPRFSELLSGLKSNLLASYTTFSASQFHVFVPYFRYCSFPAIFGHFLTEESASSALNFIRELFEFPNITESRELAGVVLRASFSFRQHCSDNFFRRYHFPPIRDAPLIDILKYSLVDSLPFLSQSAQSLLRLFAEKDPLHAQYILIALFCVPMVSLWKYMPEYTCTVVPCGDGPRESTDLLCDSLNSLDEAGKQTFCEPIFQWLSSNQNRLPQDRPIAPDVSYFSRLDIGIIDYLSRGSASRNPINVKFRLGQESIGGTDDEFKFIEHRNQEDSPIELAVPSEIERKRRDAHETWLQARDDPDPFNSQDEEIIQAEIEYLDSSVTGMRNQFQGQHQITVDTATVKSNVNALLRILAERSANEDLPTLERFNEQFRKDLSELAVEYAETAIGKKVQKVDSLSDSKKSHKSDVDEQVKRWRLTVESEKKGASYGHEELAVRAFGLLREVYCRMEVAVMLVRMSKELVGLPKRAPELARRGESRRGNRNEEWKIAEVLMLECVNFADKMTPGPGRTRRHRERHLLTVANCGYILSRLSKVSRGITAIGFIESLPVELVQSARTCIDSALVVYKHCTDGNLVFDKEIREGIEFLESAL